MNTAHTLRVKMNSLRKIPASLSGVFILEPRVFGDERGFFFESYNEQVPVLERAHRAHSTREMRRDMVRIMSDLFATYMSEPRQMPPHVHGKIVQGEPTARVVADYIAGMTDRFALDEYKKLFDPYEKV